MSSMNWYQGIGILLMLIATPISAVLAYRLYVRREHTVLFESNRFLRFAVYVNLTGLIVAASLRILVLVHRDVITLIGQNIWIAISVLASALLWFSVGGIPYAVLRSMKKFSRHTGEHVCGKCGYSAKGATTLTCTECGADFREVGLLPG